MLRVDGSRGEGGGQILRTALALSMVTGTPVRVENIRAGRQRPGLMRQHVTAVLAAQQVSGARVTGAEVGSQELTFEPGPVRPGDYSLSVGTAGSTSLVLQTILPALALAPAPSMVRLRGGTHNPMAPPFDFMKRSLLPLLAALGPRVEAALESPGFYPAGGGRVTYAIQPCSDLRPVDIVERGRVHTLQVVATVTSLPRHIAEREVEVALEALGLPADRGEVHVLKPGPGPGNVVTVDVASEALTEVFTGFGQKGVRAETVAARAAKEAADYLESGAPVGPHLADQLLLWLALAGGGRFVTVQPTRHTRTQMALLADFLGVDIRIEEVGAGTWAIAVDRPRPK